MEIYAVNHVKQQIISKIKLTLAIERLLLMPYFDLDSDNTGIVVKEND